MRREGQRPQVRWQTFESRPDEYFTTDGAWLHCKSHGAVFDVDGNSASAGSMVSGPTVKLLDKLADNELVKGVVLRINSPGGSATASEAIRLANAIFQEPGPPSWRCLEALFHRLQLLL